MLHAFHLHRNEHQDEHLATESFLLPQDDIKAIDLALMQRSVVMLQAVKTRAGNVEGNIRGKSALMRAVLKDDPVAISLLLAAGADINATDRSGISVLQMAMRFNKLNALQQLLTSENFNDNVKKQALKDTLKSKKVDAFVLLAKSFTLPDSTVKNCVSEFLCNAINKKDLISIDKLLSIPYIDVTRPHKGHSCIHWAIKKDNLAVIGKLLPKATYLFDIPLSVLIKDFSHFDSVEKYNDFYYSTDPICYLDSYSLCDPVTIFALGILQAEKDALAYAKRQRNKNESAMDDKAVSLANQHFTQKVKPHFAEKFVTMGGVIEIEKAIRKMILKAIKQDAQNPLNQLLLDYIKANKEALVNADPKVMQESLKHFTLPTTAHAAWRSYNPFAPVKSRWLNLLTRPEENENVFATTAAVEAGVITSFEASDLVREKVAYYYLAVIDETDGDEQKRRDRIGNFIGLLAEIRNAHGRDDPSCFPGYLTRIAQMGNYHAIAEQPVEIKNQLAAFFRSKVFDVFKAKTAELPIGSLQLLLRALVDLNHLTAKDIILKPSRYSAELLRIRQSFLEHIGNELALFEAFKQTTTFPLDNNDLIYFTQHMLDITRGDIAISLEEYVRRKTDRATSLEDLKALNTFDETEPVAAALFTDLLTFVQQNVPRYTNSFHQLQGYAECATYKVKQFLEQPENSKQHLQALLELMELEESEGQVVLKAFERILETHSIVIKMRIANPFEEQLKQIEQTIKHTRHPTIVVQLQKRLPSLQQKAEMFNHFIPYLTESNLESAQLEALINLIKSAIAYSVQHDAFEPENFKQSLLAEGELPICDAALNDVTNRLCEIFPQATRRSLKC